ncbi:MAG: hypothetical protein NTY81_01640 [Candidatus Staskawiczbacteria bacterium]|nr:hypothetical protein [Candidatus Staskawiczbacteria bacterium]
MLYALGVLIVGLLIAVVYTLFCFTFVKEGTAKNVVRFGGYRKTILAKRGFRLSSDGDVVEGGSSSPALLGGLRWVSLLRPLGIDRIYSRTMRYTKALPDGKFERRQDENTDFILAGTQYQYGLEFSNAEDMKKLPLHGIMTMTAMIINPYKALFLVRDWFDALVTRVLPRVRQYISEHEYDKIINDPGTQLDRDVFAMLAHDGPGGEPSIISILKNQYGIELLALETVNIDPPEGYREATLAKWSAQQTADKDMEETAGRILKSVARLAHITEDELKEKLDANPKLRGIPNSEGGFKDDFDRAWDQVKRDRAGASGDLRDIRIGSVDGTPFAQGSIAELIGGVAAAFAVKDSGGGQRGVGNPGRQGNPRGGGRNSNDDSDELVDDEDDDHPDLSKMNPAQLRAWAERKDKRKTRRR